MKKSNYIEKLNQLKDNPGAVFGLLYPYVLTVGLGIGLFYLGNIGNVAQQNILARIAPEPVLEDLQYRQPQDIPPIDVNEISTPTGEAIEIGKKIFETTCVSCHGVEGTGTGPASIGLNPAPRNFSTSEGWINGATVSGIYTTLQTGIPNSAMVAYDYFTPQEKFGLAHYIRSAFIKDPPTDTPSELTEIDKLYKLSEGSATTGQISTEYAMTLISNENNSKIQKVEATLATIQNSEMEETATLLKNVTNNLNLALSSLANSNKWKKSANSLESFLTLNINSNGFNGNIFNFSNAEWEKIYNYLNNIM